MDIVLQIEGQGDLIRHSSGDSLIPMKGDTLSLRGKLYQVTNRHIMYGEEKPANAYSPFDTSVSVDVLLLTIELRP